MRRSGASIPLLTRCGVAVVASILAVPIRAQPPGAVRIGPPEAEVRLDALVGRRPTYHAGAGVLWPVGRSVRVGAVVGGGVTDLAGDDRTRPSGRTELVARFVVDPGGAGGPRLYGGAGAGALWIADSSGRALVHLLVGLQGGGTGWEHAVELGLGGGVRLSVALRRARAAR